MKAFARFALYGICLTAPLLAMASAFADDGDLSPYEQRYGTHAYVPAYTPSAQATQANNDAPVPQAPAAMNTAPPMHVMPLAETSTVASNPDYTTNAPFNAYQQKFNVAPATDSTYGSQDKRAELDISTSYDNDPSSDVNGGSSYGIETKAYSATIDGKWRLFAGEYFAHEMEPVDEGHINYSRSTAGVEYSNNSIIANLAPTYNNYNGNERVGVAGDTTWLINDRWALGGGAELFSRDVPLRALNAGITANSYNAVADYDVDGRRDVRVNGNVMTFSDDNVRTSVAASDTEHLYISRHFTFDGLATGVESNNSANELRPYFNPRQDVLGMVGGQLGQPLYKGYGFAYDHSLQVKPGVYWQQNYGTSGAVTAGYTQHVNYKDDIDGSLGLIFTRQSSDGVSENDLAVLLNVAKKF